MGRIVQIDSGNDNLVRVVTVKTPEVLAKEVSQNYVYYNCELLFKSAITFVYKIKVLSLCIFNCTSSFYLMAIIL